MHISDVVLFLPVGDEVIGKVLDDGERFEEVISSLPVPQIAALMVLQRLPTLSEKRSHLPGRMLAELIELGNALVKTEGAQAFATAALRVLNRAGVLEGCERLAEFRIMLLDDESVAHRSYLTADRSWNSAFREWHREQMMRSLRRIDLPTGESRILTLEQTRIFAEVEGQADEPLHVQGYAGFGKSDLIKSLVALLVSKGAHVLVLAQQQRQLDALLRGVPTIPGLHAKTFETLMNEVIGPDLTRSSYWRMRYTNHSRAIQSDQTVIEHLGIRSGHAFSQDQIVRIVRRTVAKFCYGADEEICEKHIPNDVVLSLDATARQVVLHHSVDLWRAILSPASRDFRPPVRGFHRIKWAALHRLRIPDYYTHVLIDECHDLSQSMAQILDHSPQIVVSLGDEYQHLGGRPQRRSSVPRQRAVGHSFRSGRAIEEIVNPLITSHPGQTKLEFNGNTLCAMEISYYDRVQIPQQPAVILVHDWWSLFEWAQCLAEQVELELLADPFEMDMFVTDCIELYLRRTWPRHGKLFRFGTWEAVGHRHHRSPGFERMDGRLRKGFCWKDWKKTSERFVERSGYALGLIENARNREFDTVMLVPEIVDWAWAMKDRDRAAVNSAIYVAVTRARRRLIAPRRLRNWIEEISRARRRA